MPGGRSEGVDNTDARPWFECRHEIVKGRVWLRDLVIHVHQDRHVERTGRQPRIVRLAKPDGDVLQSESAHALAQTLKVFGHDIFGDDAAAGAHDRRQPHDIVATAGADVGDGHSRFDAEPMNELAGLAGGVALRFVVPNRAHDVGNRTIRFRKRGGRRTRWCQEVLRRARLRRVGLRQDWLRQDWLRQAGQDEGGGNYCGNGYSHHVAYDRAPTIAHL